MITFASSLLLLLLGYLVYGTIVERVFGADKDRATPCYTKADGVDFIPMASWRVFLIQFLNIAGTGPIFGAIMGILFGPSAYLWIVFGCIFAGATHDYMSGMISLRKGGASLPELVGDELGSTARFFLRVVSVGVLVLVGTVFVTTPASLLATLTPNWGAFGTVTFWTILVFLYYILATLLPVDALIGRIYPLFGCALLFMAFGIGISIFTHEGWMPEVFDGLASQHPKGLGIFPMLCITIACGAISGFHATQSPLMARCIKNERLGRPIFYGSMITEGVVALIWAAAAIKFAGSYQNLADMGNPATVVGAICKGWLGTAGAVLAVLGVVAAPITSGDTAFRSARLIVADFIHIKQDKLWRRLALSLPLFAISVVLMLVNFDVLWRYFAWFNQSFSCFTLWAVTVWLFHQKKCFWITLIPALFMTMVCSSYIVVAPEGFHFPIPVGLAVGAVFDLVCLGLFYFRTKRG